MTCCAVPHNYTGQVFTNTITDRVVSPWGLTEDRTHLRISPHDHQTYHTCTVQYYVLIVTMKEVISTIVFFFSFDL